MRKIGAYLFGFAGPRKRELAAFDAKGKAKI